MTDISQSGPVLAADGTPLKRSLSRALRMQKLRALMLIAPLLLFILVTFILPVADMLFRSVENRIVQDTLPRTVEALADWDPASGQLPEEAVFAAMAADLQIAAKEKTHTRVAKRLNYENPGVSSVFRKSGRKVGKWDLATDGPFREKLIEIDDGWGDVELWRTIKTYSGSFTSGYFLNAVDMQLGAEGPEIRPENERIYNTMLVRTMRMSLIITFSCILLGYPVAWILANLPARKANLLLILVLLPFWTSLLVRTSAWKILLQQQGVINDTLVWIGLVDDANRLVLINNELGTIIAMTHILLPFMILPMYSVMQTINPSYLRAAKSLGATDWTAFWRVYFPQTVPGIGAGSILVFILAVGYYITPALVGGTKGTFISNLIAYHISTSGNWGLGAALGAILLAVVLLLYWVYDKVVGIDNVKLG
ncbi:MULTISPECIES: ABC transporter permease [unclassified Leisingera]|uniref:ABC transporter permease n=1 Tax=unclassified Leisingera TaxID=2614906 RepID=UPI0002FCF0E7|nr:MULTISPECIES: ABC transporter permease [unclassified Leisingera]KIC18332.1 ABC transporter permease [Leisingera sp. ANG-DT]KIC24242.1 ABC transporter permease [Leisingera sp. ANG-S3]KIC26949.1 ABC transporter permease [Leisingera sp. ANG-M6]KIC33000.1 ABC transporter permease [Leisingera sp. ANG-S5]KIC52958.1 ABC transporter permease [Leisingera sp. ANG-S]